MELYFLGGALYPWPSRIRNEYITTRVFNYVEIENPSTRSQVN